jgi:glycosyltransferase involved in cell wall biosynthesis
VTSPVPLVSIAIRAYRQRWLAEAIASVLAQTHRDLELIVYDDAGDLEPIAASFADARIRYHRAAVKRQASGRFMAAIGLCRGRYLGVLDDDDRYEPEFVERLLAGLQQNSRTGVAFCRTTWEWHGRRIAPYDARPPGPLRGVAEDMLANGWTVSPSQMLIRRAAYDDAQLPQPMIDGVAPDVFINLRIALAGWQHVLVDAPLVVCRWHDGQLSRSPAEKDTAVATWEAVEIRDSALAALRDRRLARALIVRAFERMRSGEMIGARDDLNHAARVCPSGWSRLRRSLQLLARSGSVGHFAAWATMKWSPQFRARREPPRAIGDRALKVAQ